MIILKYETFIFSKKTLLLYYETYLSISRQFLDLLNERFFWKELIKKNYKCLFWI